MTDSSRSNHFTRHSQPQPAASPSPSSPCASSEADPAEPYTIYTNFERWCLVLGISLAAMFSPLPANVFFPAIDELAREFGVKVGKMNLSVTVYLAFQGISPMLWGPLSDRYGRRPVAMLCLSILTLSCIGLALTPTSAFWLLLLLRCVQAAGCASMIALGAGVIGDITERKDRGSKYGLFNLGPMVATNLGPVLGGVLTQSLGWRSVFWFLTVGSVVCILFVGLLLPETLRALVGNGSIVLPRIRQPPITVFGRGKRTVHPDPSVAKEVPPIPNPLLLFKYPDLVITLAFTAVVYAVNYSITATISSSFAELYPYLSETDIGLVYLSTGGGMIVGSTLTGNVLDWDFQRVKREEASRRSLADPSFDATADFTKQLDFPIEEARLRLIPAHLVLFIAAVIGWGWSSTSGASIAVPLVLNFVLGYTSMAVLNSSITLGLDLNPEQSSSTTACFNLTRCGLAAILVAVINMATDKLGFGWTYTILGLITCLLLPMMFLEMRVGERFRRRRAEKNEQ